MHIFRFITQHTAKHRRTQSLALLTLLALSLQINGTNVLAKDKPRVQNFLPPVAMINERIESMMPEVQEAIEPLTLSAVDTIDNTPDNSLSRVRLKPKVEKLEKTLTLNEEQQQEAKDLLSLQQALDQQDLETLWAATIERNPVIRFSLDKMNTPVDLQPQKSSIFLNKALNGMIQGAAILSAFAPGGGYYQNLGVMSAAQAGQNLVNRHTLPEMPTITATEQVQLAGLIDDLKSDLVKNYHNYKEALAQLEAARKNNIRANTIYSKVLAGKDNFNKMMAADIYYKAKMNETLLKQQAKLYRMELERLAGEETIDNLQLALFFEADMGDNEPRIVQESTQAESTIAAADTTTIEKEKSSFFGKMKDKITGSDNKVAGTGETRDKSIFDIGKDSVKEGRSREIAFPEQYNIPAELQAILEINPSLEQAVSPEVPSEEPSDSNNVPMTQLNYDDASEQEQINIPTSNADNPMNAQDDVIQ